MKIITSMLTLIAAFTLAVPVTSNAETKKKPAATETKTDAKKEEGKKKNTYPLYGVVVSITDKLLTIKGGEGKEDRKYDITKDTKIHDGDKPATIKDVKVGAWVGGLLEKTGKGNDEVVSLNIGVKQKGEKKEEAKTETPKKKK